MIQSNGLFEFGQIELNERIEMLSLSSETHHQWKSKLTQSDEKGLRDNIYPALLSHFDKSDTLSLVVGHFAVHQAMEQYVDILFTQNLNQNYIDSMTKHALKLSNHGVTLSLYSIIAFEFKRLIVSQFSEIVSCENAIDLLNRRMQLDMMLVIDCLHHKELEDIKRYASLMDVKDSLTDLYTYNTFADEMDRIIAHCQRTQSSALLLKVNIKDLAGINATHGYDAGNEILRAFAQSTQELIRKSDLLARGEDDNFFLIMPETCNKEAKLICERIIEQFEQHADLPVTLRFGASSFDPKKRTSVEQMLFLANEHLGFARDRSKITDKHEISVHFPHENNIIRLLK